MTPNDELLEEVEDEEEVEEVEEVDEYGDTYKTSYDIEPEDNDYIKYDDCYSFEKNYSGYHYEY